MLSVTQVSVMSGVIFQPEASNNQRFRLRLYAKLFFDDIHNKIRLLPNLMASSAFAVDEHQCVLLAGLCTTDLMAFQAGVINQPAGAELDITRHTGRKKAKARHFRANSRCGVGFDNRFFKKIPALSYSKESGNPHASHRICRTRSA